MRTKLLTINEQDLEKKEGQAVIDRAAALLKEGQVVAFPTETVYGLGANGMDAQASGKIYAAKGRPSDNPLILHIGDFSGVYDIARDISEDAVKLMKTFWPGPMTIILSKKPEVPKETTGGLDTVAIRMPSHPIARALLKKCAVPIAAPSANRSGRPSPTTAAHVMEDMEGRIPLILDGGKVGIGIESTIIDMTGEKPVILRPGYITPEMIEQVVSGVSIDPAILAGPMDAKVKPKAPGMKYRHYAPLGEMTLVEGDDRKVIDKINELVKKKTEEGFKVGVIGTEENKTSYRADFVISMGSRRDPASIAANLYGSLRQMDELGAEIIYAESFEDGDFYGAIRNRILKAAGYQVIKV